jgi:hypothetical protein
MKRIKHFDVDAVMSAFENELIDRGMQYLEAELCAMIPEHAKACLGEDMDTPHSMTIPMTPEKFAAMQAKYKVTEQHGTIDDHDATLTWTYNGTDALIVTVTALKSFLARHAPTSTVEGHITDAINQA